MLKSRITETVLSSTPRWMQVALLGAAILAAAILYVSSNWLIERFTETQSNEAQLRATLYSGNVTSLLQQQSLVPLLLARDPIFTSALQLREFSNTSQRLIEFAEEIRAEAIHLLDLEGRAVASSDRRKLGTSYSEQPYFVHARRENGTIFTVTDNEISTGSLKFHYARGIISGNETLGIIVVEVNMRQLEESWRKRRDLVVITDSQDNIILSSRPGWNNLNLSEVLTGEPNSQTEIQERVTADQKPVLRLDNGAFLRSETAIGFRGWRLNYFSALSNIRLQVIGALAVELMVMALLVAIVLFFVSRQTRRESKLIAFESSQLRALNARLSEEIAERQRVEKNLQNAELSLEQASKLAAMGQMSAAVSHELNQPLAAMRTYLAGARLLIQRKHPEEALSSFHRIDDLIERMGTITKQLKSYARKGHENLKPVDLRDAIDGSLSMMSPQLSVTEVEIRKSLPTQPVMVLADPVRLDQIIVNLLRNALDAVSVEERPVIDILLVEGRQASLSVRDNGSGIADPEQLFEPFYTTKQPGDGVGLGLAISAGIASELGGRLIARNADPKGAVFELQLPRADMVTTKAAE